VIVDAYLKNIRDGIDWNLAYEAIVNDAEVEPPNWDVEGTYLPRSISRLSFSLTIAPQAAVVWPLGRAMGIFPRRTSTSTA